MTIEQSTLSPRASTSNHISEEARQPTEAQSHATTRNQNSPIIALPDSFEPAPVTARANSADAVATKHAGAYKTVRLASRILREVSNVANSLPNRRGPDLGNYNKVELLGPWDAVQGPCVFANQHVRSPGDATALGTFFDSRPDSKPIFLMGEGPFSAFCKRFAPQYFAFVSRASVVQANESSEEATARISKNEAAVAEAFNKIVAEGGIGCIYPDETIHHDGREEIRKSKGIKGMSLGADGSNPLPVWFVSMNYDSISHKKPKAFLSLSSSPVFIKQDAPHETLCKDLTHMLVANETLDISKIIGLYLVKQRPAQFTKERLMGLVRDVVNGAQERGVAIPVDPELTHEAGRFKRVDKAYRQLQALGYVTKDGSVVSRKLIQLPDLTTPQLKPSQRFRGAHLKDPVGHGAVREWQRAQVVEPLKQIYEEAFAEPAR